jgi:hypothetical protein
MQRLLAAGSVALSIAVLLSHGCLDDRAGVVGALFACNPNSPTADADCGAGYVCYKAAQAVGGAFCVPHCSPKFPQTCVGLCTEGGECLQRCHVESQKSECPPQQRCVRTTDAPLDTSASPANGVCLLVNASCAVDADCTGAVYNTCASSTTNMNPTGELPTSGSICAQGGCHARGTACVPGSSCVQDILPPASGAPDACAPDCVARQLSGGAPVYECIPGFTCLSTAFPQNGKIHTCVPGQPGWLCTDGLGCQQGHCDDWHDVDTRMSGFKSCAPPCHVDDDCLPFETGGNSTFLSKLTCRNGRCRTVQSFFFSLACFNEGEACPLDKDGSCETPMVADDGGAMMTADPCRATFNFGPGVTAVCQRSCASDDDCATLTANVHTPFTCTQLPNGSAICIPSFPAGPCTTDATCMGDLKCLDAGPEKMCTRACNTDPDCWTDAALGGAFYCAQLGPVGRCLPRAASGCPPQGGQDSCLSGAMQGGTCVSPPGWPCDAPEQCASGTCECHHTIEGNCVAGRCT